jgi:hypothetical protein
MQKLRMWSVITGKSITDFLRQFIGLASRMAQPAVKNTKQR